MQQLSDGAMPLIDGRIRISPAPGIGIGNGDAAKWGAAEDMRPLGFRDVRIEQGIVFGRITMRPSVHGDGRDVAGGVEASSLEGAGQLIAYVALESLERSVQ